MADELEDVKKASEAAAKGIFGLAGAAAKTAGVFMLTKPSIESATKNLPILGGVVSQVAKVIEGQVSQYQALTNAGANFGGNLALMTQNATAAGLSVKEMTGLVAGNSEALASFGMNVDDGMNNFLGSLKKMREDGNRYGLQLRNIGLTHEEIGEMMVLTQRMEMMAGRNRQLSEQQLQQKTAAYAKDLDMLAKLTGRNVDELKKEQTALQRQGDFRAKTLGMDVEMRQQIMKSSSLAEASGVGDLFKDMMIRGFPSAETAVLAGQYKKTFAVMNKMYAAQEAGDMVQYKKLQGQLELATMEDKVNMRSMGLLGGRNKASQAVSETYAKSAEYQMGIMAQMEAGTITTAEAGELLVKRAKEAEKQQKLQGGDVKTGQKGDVIDDNRKVLNAALRGQEAMITAAVKVQAEVTEKLYNQYMGPIFESMASGAGMDRVTQAADAGIAAIGDQLAKSAPGTLIANPGQTDADIRAMIADLDNKMTTANEETAIKASNAASDLQAVLQGGDRTNLEAELKNAYKILGKEAPSQQDESVKIIQGIPNVFNRGTPGMDQALQGFSTFASMTQDFGKQSLALLHGKELVMTEEQAKLLDEGIKSLAEQAGIAFTQLQAKGNIDATSMKSLKESAFRQFGSGDVAGLAERGATNASANRQGAINTIRSKGDTNQESDLKAKMSEIFEAVQMGQKDTVNAMIASMPNKEVFDGLLETSKQQLGSTMQQLGKMDAGNKLTKKLSKVGNAFGGGISV